MSEGHPTIEERMARLRAWGRMAWDVSMEDFERQAKAKGQPKAAKWFREAREAGQEEEPKP